MSSLFKLDWTGAFSKKSDAPKAWEITRQYYDDRISPPASDFNLNEKGFNSIDRSG